MTWLSSKRPPVVLNATEPQEPQHFWLQQANMGAPLTGGNEQCEVKHKQTSV
eukprot:CAMPEP_0177164120 /NCGR_PEP_ID=MMETSP0367-20130122/6770_1 /TAXON_ID=447022 ORGANISM="Scrippsiella hangoei-like, Strain SHHI-4" /NCGR_SAMPLE_ID=MMETSP0367 /ASSEMBLY_ACC=CAM_ASM_000362 /LENGTH=51 /DNA_ID=CAMNT_0018609979 /DNA_START=511 /DNA_END=666 /DNA_ORIENTATION=+